MATRQMPQEQSIACGEPFPVRGDRLWTTSPSSSLSSVDTDASLLSSDDAETPSSASSDDASSSDSDFFEQSPLPPSPPIKALLGLPAAVLVKPAPSPASSTDSRAASLEGADYFGAPTFLSKVFPRSKVVGRAVAVHTSVASWQLAVFDDGAARTLYARGAAGFEDMNLRENLVQLLDHADEALDCDQVVVVLDKKDANLASILHSLMYVGGVVVPASSASIHKKHSSKCVLVGIDL